MQVNTDSRDSEQTAADEDLGLRQKQLMRLFKEKFNLALESEEAGCLMKEWDEDKSGTIGLDEFLQMVSRFLKQHEVHWNLLRAFAELTGVTGEIPADILDESLTVKQITQALVKAGKMDEQAANELALEMIWGVSTNPLILRAMTCTDEELECKSSSLSRGFKLEGVALARRDTVLEKVKVHDVLAEVMRVAMKGDDKKQPKLPPMGSDRKGHTKVMATPKGRTLVWTDESEDQDDLAGTCDIELSVSLSLEADRNRMKAGLSMLPTAPSVDALKDLAESVASVAHASVKSIKGAGKKLMSHLSVDNVQVDVPDTVAAKIWVFLNEPDKSYFVKAAKAFQMFMFFLVFFCVLAMVVETIPAAKDGIPKVCWDLYNIIITAIFSAEYIVRLATARAIPDLLMTYWKFLSQPMNVCDLLACMPLYIDLVVGSVAKEFWLLRMARLARIQRIQKYGNVSVLVGPIAMVLTVIWGIYYKGYGKS